MKHQIIAKTTNTFEDYLHTILHDFHASEFDKIFRAGPNTILLAISAKTQQL